MARTHDDTWNSLYLTEGMSQCQRVLRSAHRLNDAMSIGDAELIWDCIDQIISSSIRVANLFWPGKGARGSAVPRAESLRKLMDLPPSMSTSVLRDVRNAFEHFDEKIDDWVAEKPKITVDKIVGNDLGALSFNGRPANETGVAMRSFETSTSRVQILGFAMNLQDLVTEIDRLVPVLHAAELALGKNHPASTKD